MNRLTLALAAASAIPLLNLSTTAVAQESCASRAQIIEKLARDFKENQQAVGFVNEQAILEIYVSSNGTWTILATGTDGTSCVLSAGEDWQGANVVHGLDTGFHRPATTSAD